jgi:hypothetical protein
MRRKLTLGKFARRAATPIALLASFALAFADPQATPDSGGLPGAESTALSAEAQAALREVLNFDPVRAMTPASPLRVPSQKASAHDLDWNRTEKADGSAALTVKKPLPFIWDAKVGADFGLAAAPAASSQLEKLLQSNKDQGMGAAWASVTVPGLASIDARVDPGKEQSKLGTTLSRSLALGSQYSVTLQNSYALTETRGSAPMAPAIASAVTPAASAQVWSTDRLVKFNILSTGTTLAAGTSSSTADNVTHNKISAEQKLFGPLSVTTALTDVGALTSSKSISAGFKLKW